MLSDHFAFIPPFLLFTLIWLTLNVELTRFINNATVRKVIHGAWSIFVFIIVAFEIAFDGSFSSLLLNLTLAVVLLIASTLTTQTLGAVMGVVALVVTLFVKVSDFMYLALDTGWISMAIAGTSIIVAGSLLERFWPLIKLKLAGQFSEKNEDIVDHDTFDTQPDMGCETQAGIH